MFEPLLSLPTPLPDHDSAAFWEGCKEERLLLQRCESCGKFRYPPRPLCPFCHTFGGEWTEVSGRGTLYSWTVAHHPVHPALKDRVPYTCVVVDLPEGPRIASTLAAENQVELEPGMPLVVTFLRVDEDTVLPYFRTDDTEGA